MDTSEESAIKGKHIAITGSLLFYKRQEAFELIRGLGGIPQENVTRETDYLVVGHYRKNTIIGDRIRSLATNPIKGSSQSGT